MAFDKCPSCGQLALIDQALPRQAEAGQVIYGRVCDHCGKTYGMDVPSALPNMEKTLSLPMFADYVQVLLWIKEGVVCMCGEYVFDAADLRMYPHDGGMHVPYKEEKQWVYGQCQNKACRYQMASWKMKQYRRKRYD